MVDSTKPDLLDDVFQIAAIIQEMGHDMGTVIPFWPEDKIMPGGQLITFRDYPQLTVGDFLEVCRLAKAQRDARPMIPLSDVKPLLDQMTKAANQLLQHGCKMTAAHTSQVVADFVLKHGGLK